MSPAYFMLGLIGYPLEKSLSPAIHQAALRASGLAGEYRLYPVLPLPEGQPYLADRIDQLRQGKLHGLNVTIPHKQNVLAYLDGLTPAAEAIGAANTLYIENGALLGDNTDIPGFSADLRRLLPGEPGRALVLGAGGSARAVVYALGQEGWQVTLAARRLEQADELLLALNAPVSFRAIPISSITRRETAGLKLIINTTPVGMIPNSEASPWPEGVPLPQGALLYDLIYKPPQTLLMSQALQAGMQAANGLGMLVEQAALSFERWTGLPADRSAIWAALSAGQNAAR